MQARRARDHRQHHRAGGSAACWWFKAAPDERHLSIGRPAEIRRIPLSQRRKFQTRIEIAKAALRLFARDGYDTVGLDAVAEEAGVSLRTLYRYFPAKDELLSPLVMGGTAGLAELLAARPAEEPLVEAVQHAYEERAAFAGPGNVRVLIGQLVSVPALRARWLDDLRTIEEALAPVIQEAPAANWTRTRRAARRQSSSPRSAWCSSARRGPSRTSHPAPASVRLCVTSARVRTSDCWAVV